MTVDNKNNKKLELVIKTVDLQMDKAGNALISDQATDPYSCAGWLNFGEKKIVVAANSKKQIPVTIKVPPGASGGKYGIVLFQTAVQGTSNNELLLVGQMGTIFMLEIQGMKKIQGGINEFRAHPENGSTVFYSTIANLGNTHFQVRGSIVIKDRENKIVDRVNLTVGTGTILPGHSREFTAKWINRKKIPQGNYQAILQVNIPGQGATLQKIIDINR